MHEALCVRSSEFLQFSWSSLEIELELLQDPDMLLMFEKGIRGGIIQAVHRYAKSNNKYMDNYNPKAPSSYMPTIFMDGQCLNSYLLEDSSG